VNIIKAEATGRNLFHAEQPKLFFLKNKINLSSRKLPRIRTRIRQRVRPRTRQVILLRHNQG
jgi:hypothetical protein